jgi:uncharacterized RDD family membrane protein YckC
MIDFSRLSKDTGAGNIASVPLDSSRPVHQLSAKSRKGNMTRSYGSGGGSGGTGDGGSDWQRPPKRPELRNREPRPELRQSEPEPELFESEPESDIGESADTGWETRLNRLSRYSAQEQQIDAVRVDFGRRLVSLMLDMVAAYMLSAFLSVLPFINAFVTTTLVLTVVMLVRDYFFAGRGVGKNLMGLQVVDVRSGHPCSLIQSVKRNVIILGPLLVMQVIMFVLRITNSFTSGPVTDDAMGHAIGFLRSISDALPGLVNLLGGIYVMAVLPYEAYRVYNRADGRRFGDVFAGTAVIDAPMDFSSPLPRQ